MECRIFILAVVSVLICNYVLPAEAQGKGGSGSTRSRPSYSKDLETALRTELFTDYHVLQRPSQQVVCWVSLTLLTINDMNIKDQTLAISGYLTLVWRDSRLNWYNTQRTQDYTNIKFLFSTETYVWRPSIIIENSIDDISVISDNQIPMRMVSMGIIVWSPAGIYRVSCESDTTYYPMDYQTCTIKVSTWGYTQSEIMLLYSSTPVHLTFYTPNGEWDLLSAIGAKTEEKSRGGQVFSSLTFQITLQRRPMFHVMNTLFPVALMAFLIPMVFKLPSDSGEKIGYSLTVLLAYAVYLTLISENIPSTSVTICYLSVYLALTLMYGTISVVFVIAVLSLNHKPEEDPIPRVLRFITLYILMPMVCWKDRCCCFRCRKKKKKNSVEPIPMETISTIEKRPYPSAPASKGPKTVMSLEEFIGQEQAVSPPPMYDDEVKVVDDPPDEDVLTWKTISAVFDNFFFLFTMFLVLATTITCFTMIALHYFNEVEK